MKTNIVALLALFCSFNLQAQSNFFENPYTPYPPGCATIPDFQANLYGDNVVKFFEQEIPLSLYTRTQSADVNVAAYRVGCADSNRSVIWLAFSLPAGTNGTLFYTPEIRAVTGEGYTYVVTLAREPNSWDVGIEPWNHGQVFGGDGGFDFEDHKTWIFVLDNTSPFNSPSGVMSPSQYNGSFSLELNWRDDSTKYVIEVPSTASVLTANPRIPLSGRLSGNWVVEGASDQGFVISISEVIGVLGEEYWDVSLLMFLSWYTYDANGDKLWLTGAAQFLMGTTEVTIPIEDVSNGEFMGGKTADRKVVGSVTITGNNCNDLTFQYDLTDIGLGSGTEHLERLFSLETAGYVCRDLEARMATK